MLSAAMTATPAPSVDTYLTDVTYPDHFHREIMPVWLCSALEALGHRPPDINRAYTWLDLGCGAGLNTVLAAATNPLGQFIGLDINPEAIRRAQDLADAAGLRNVRFICQGFDEALQAPDGLQACDFVVSHGVYSWISPSQRSAMRQLIDRVLAPGGVCYLGYMSQPGSASMAAAQKLLYLSAQGLPGNSTERARQGLQLLQQLAASGAGYFQEQPRAAQEIQRLADMDPAYVAHEMLNPHWESLHVADVIGDMQPLDCTYVGSATLLENIDAASLPAHSQPLLLGLQRSGASAALQETFKDLVRNQNQRRDLFQRQHPQGIHLSEDAHRQRLLAQRVCLLPQAPDLAREQPGELVLETRIGPVRIPMSQIQPLLMALQTGPQSYAALAELPLYRRQPGLISQMLQLLAWAGWIQFLRPNLELTPAAPPTQLNQALASRPVGQAGRLLAASASGSAVGVLASWSAEQRQRLHWLGAAA